ncbi:MAG: transcriptional regulator with XRE-family HTH domain [Cognaticolwellia sp.]|jgi:transcriptional regulator with XRE-family HTH domain
MIDLLLTPQDLQTRIAGRVRDLRKRQGWTQQELAERSGLGVATVARLERNGQAQFSTILLVSAALGRLDDFQAILEAPAPESMAELLGRAP